MNKNRYIRTLALVLSAVLIVTAFSSCGAQVKNSNYASDYSIKNEALFLDSNGSDTNGKLSGENGTYIDISFRRPIDINTLVLNEDGDNITEYEIFAMGKDGFQSIYKQDKVGAFRYCAFKSIKTDCIRLKINNTKNNSFEITNIDILNVSHTREKFRVTTYATVDTIYDVNSLDPKHFDVITDVILFGAASFNENGEIVFTEYDIAGQKVGGKDALKTAISNIKSVAGKSVKLYVNLLGPDGSDAASKEAAHNNVFNSNAEKLSSEIRSLLVDLKVDGVYFDYEYPYKNSGWKAYSNFLCTLDKEIGEKKIGVAIGPWGGKLTNKAKKAVDYLEVMAYDMFDADGYHATFAGNGGAQALDFISKNGYDMEKADLGVPFYGRPIDKNAVWTSYNSCYEKLGKFGNVDSSIIEVEHTENDVQVNGPFSVPRYYNSFQMIYDKASFAYDYGAGGIMVWHYACDAKVETGLSLFDAISQAIYDREQ